MVARRLAFAALAHVAVAAAAHAAQPELPSFLPPYYASAFALDGQPLQLLQTEEKDGVARYAYATADKRIGVSVEGLACDRPRCQTVFDNAVAHFNKQVTGAGGAFRAVGPTEFRADWPARLSRVSAFVFKLPRSLQFWILGAPAGQGPDAAAQYAAIEAMVDRQRYEEAQREGNVEMSVWSAAAHRHARRLLDQGQKAEALAVLRNLLATAPFHFEAHLDLARHSGDRAAAQTSAGVVFDNAESPELVARAARLLGREEPSLAALPALKPGERGLQVILIPLEPVDLRLVEAAARIYEQITAVPVRLARLPEPWTFGVPDRMPEQRTIQRAIIQHRGLRVDFTDWTREQYVGEVLKIVEGKDALARFQAQAFVDKLDERPVQYDAEPYLLRLLEMLAPYRPAEARAMLVGVTAANIYAGDTNYLFSQHMGVNGVAASLLSYGMMTAKALGEPYESRKRLAERLAKELVPASLKSLGIARAADPTDPYSYSDGVTRLDQKSLTLSAPTKAALDTFR